MAELGKGTQLAGRFTLERLLGGGGEARIWLARDRMTSAAVALKIVAGRRAAERLRREWQSNLRLLHAHIVRVFEFHEDEDRAFYSMQYIDGPDVGVLAGRPIEEILPAMGLVAEALRYAHGKDIVHRDVKASNILLDHNGAPYLCDFGVAAATGVDADGGSPIAASPESLSGSPASPADDIFALGGLVYELVAGRPPLSPADKLAEAGVAVPPLVAAADGSVAPPAVQDLVGAMLARNPGARPDAETVVARLRAAGYAPGTARIRVSGQPRVEDERIETVHAVRRAAAAAETPAAAVDAGISPRTLGIMLAVLVLVLVLVVVVLPGEVRRDREEQSRQNPAAIQGTTSVREGGLREGEEGTGEGDTPARVTREFDPESRGLDDEVIRFNENEAD